MTTSTRKRVRVLTWNPSLNTVYTFQGVIKATLDNDAEPDRQHVLELADAAALRLAARLAQQVGYRLERTQ